MSIPIVLDNTEGGFGKHNLHNVYLEQERYRKIVSHLPDKLVRTDSRTGGEGALPRSENLIMATKDKKFWRIMITHIIKRLGI